MRETGGTLLLLASVAVLLHLPFADSGFSSHGPGGLLGEWLGGIAAGFIGSVGAALGATTTLVVALLLVTDVSTHEVGVVLAWAGRHALRGAIAGASGSWRVLRAAFPEKDDRDDRRQRREPESEEALANSEHQSIQIHPVEEAHADTADEDETELAVRVLHTAYGLDAEVV